MFDEDKITRKIKEHKEAIKELEEELSLYSLLLKLYHHHKSQSKMRSASCSKAYHKSLADELKVLIFKGEV